MNNSMEVWLAASAYTRSNGMPTYEEFTHPPVSKSKTTFTVQCPQVFLPWDAYGGVVALRRRDKQIALCRCGVVLSCVYFRMRNPGAASVPVALKLMDRRQVRLQRDDMDNELRVMARLQMAGVDVPLQNPHMIKWEFQEDAYNHYLATEFVSNGSLASYAHMRIRRLLVDQLRYFAEQNGGRDPNHRECVTHIHRRAGDNWIREGVGIFSEMMKGLTYMHAQGVAHLDLDIYNVAIDKQGTARILDFGSAQIVSHDGTVGHGFTVIKSKPTYAAPELKRNARLRPPRPGFNGIWADLWSAGVILVQCIVWGFQDGPVFLSRHPHWRREVFQHIDGECGNRLCYFCYHLIHIPLLIGSIIKSLLQDDPRKRASAYDVAIALQQKTEAPLLSQQNRNRRRIEPVPPPPPFG